MTGPIPEDIERNTFTRGRRPGLYTQQLPDGPNDAEILAVCRRIVAAQAGDDALWCEAGSIVEAYAQQELRALHRAVEGDLAAVAAIEDL